MNVAAASVRVRVHGEVVVEELSNASLELFDGATQWREFRSYRDQRHYSGSYWCATTGAHVGYESRLELSNLLCEDFNPASVWILSQPFLLEGADGRRIRRHVPDYLVEHGDGSVCVIDVKPSRALSNPKVQQSLKWTAELMSAVGWEYRIQTEPEPVRLANLRFLAGYRRPFQFLPVEVEAIRVAIDGPMTIGQAIRAANAAIETSSYSRGIVLHLLWSGALVADLTVPLESATILEPA